MRPTFSQGSAALNAACRARKNILAVSIKRYRIVKPNCEYVCIVTDIRPNSNGHQAQNASFGH